jgi:hypothetical protein
MGCGLQNESAIERSHPAPLAQRAGSRSPRELALSLSYDAGIRSIVPSPTFFPRSTR